MVRRFLNILEALDAESDFQRGVRILFEYLGPMEVEDFDWAIPFLMRDVRPPNRLKTRLRDYVCEATSSSGWMLEACKGAVKEVSETYTLMLDTAGIYQGARVDMTLAEFGEDVWSPLILALKSGSESEVRAIWAKLDIETGRLLNRLIMCAPVRRKAVSILATALAPMFETVPALMYWRLLRGPDLLDTYDNHLAELPSNMEMECLSIDWGFPCDPGSWSGEKSPIEEWIVEPAYEGVRVQIKKTLFGAVQIWDDAGVWLNPVFPDLEDSGARLPLGLTLEGCVVAWEFDRPAESGRLSQRLNREKATLELARATPVRFFVSSAITQDGLELEDLDFDGRRRLASETLDALRRPRSLHRNQPKRRGSLGQLELFELDLEPEPEPEAPKASSSEEGLGESWIAMCETLDARSWEDVEASLNTARGRRWVGVRLWRRSSRGDERVESHFLPAPRLRARLALVGVKVKLDSGRREIESLDFAARDGDANPVVATVPVDGIDPEWMDGIVELAKRPLARKGPILFVEPSRVFELAFDRVVKTNKRRSGLALVAPRVTGWVEGASLPDVATLSSLLERVV